MPDLPRAARAIALALTLAACRERPDAAPQPTAAPPTPLLVTVEQGQLRGTTQERAEVFRNVPYAAPPLGDRRFRPPAPPEPWTGIRDATRFGKVCAQPGLGASPNGDEDCLSLNIWRPSAASEGPRPVLLFIHGGANAIGSGADAFVHGWRLAQDNDVIVVTINYRLGLAGFLAHPALTRESGTSGNWAYLDMIAALRWIQRNIAAFGGDPQRVTIFGESAGALGVCVLLASPLAKGLFAGAIMQSGGCDVAPLARREAEGERLVAAAGCADSPDPLACLRALPIARLIEIAPAVTADVSNWALPIAGAVDGQVVPRSPLDAFAAGAHNRVPTLVGNNADETQLFTPPTMSSCAAYQGAIGRIFAESAPAILAEYPCSDDAQARETYVAVTTDALFNCQTRRVLRGLTGGATPSYRYYYAYTRADPAVQPLRAFHGGELQLIFGSFLRLGYEVPPTEHELAATLQRSWTSLARTGSPVITDTPNWAPYSAARDNAVVFDVPVTTQDAVATERCDFWDQLANR